MLGAILVGVLGVAAGGASSASSSPTQGDAARARHNIFEREVRLRPLAKTDPSLLGRTDSAPVNVMVKYDFDATASYPGGVAGLAATSPRKTGKSLKDNKAAVAAYEQYTTGLADKIDAAAIQQAVPDIEIRTSYQTVYGGVRRRCPRTRSAALLRRAGRRRGAEGRAEPAARRQHAVHRRDQRLAVARRVGERRLERDRRRHRHRRLARASDARRRAAAPRARGRPQGLQTSATARTSRTSARRSRATTS